MSFNNLAYCICIFFSLSASDIGSQSGLPGIIETYEAFEETDNKKDNQAWPDYSDEKVQEKIDTYSTLLSELKLIEKEKLDDVSKINCEMLVLILENKLFQLQFGTHMMELNSEGGFIISMIYNTRSLDVESKDSRNNYLEKLADTPRYLEQQTQLLRRGIEQNKLRPKIVVENCLTVLEDLLKNSGDDFFLFKALKSQQVLDQKLKAEVFQSFEKLYGFLKDEYMVAAPENIGISEIENGKSFYQQRINYFTTLKMSPLQIFDIGMKEVDRIKAEMNEVIESLGFEGDFQDFIKYLREDPKFYPKSENELLYYAAWLSKKAEEILPRYFGKLPRLPFTVTAVPDEIAPNYTTGRYSGGSMDNQRAGQYWVNTYDLASRPLYVLPALTLHEAVPGHHLQGSLANELIDLPKFRSHYLSAFGEGWGLYSEFLGKEAGIYTDLYQEFGRLTYEMWRACRLVVDPGMHFFGWTREEAVKYMRDNTSLTFHEIDTEINRYIGWPGQAVSYKIGELKIRELRKLAEEKLGENFNIRSFHDRILSNGSIPLLTLDRIVQDYIKEKSEDAKKN